MGALDAAAEAPRLLDGGPTSDAVRIVAEGIRRTIPRAADPAAIDQAMRGLATRKFSIETMQKPVTKLSFNDDPKKVNRAVLLEAKHAIVDGSRRLATIRTFGEVRHGSSDLRFIAQLVPEPDTTKATARAMAKRLDSALGEIGGRAGRNSSR
jgi:hypothetical protein